MKVTVKYFTTLREITGMREELVEVEEGTTILQLMQKLAEKHGIEFKKYVFDNENTPKDFLQFLIDGQSTTTMKGNDTELREGVKVAIIPPVGGGQQI